MGLPGALSTRLSVQEQTVVVRLGICPAGALNVDQNVALYGSPSPHNYKQLAIVSAAQSQRRALSGYPIPVETYKVPEFPNGYLRTE